MSQDVRDLPPCQPETDGQGERDGDGEERGEYRGGHMTLECVRRCNFQASDSRTPPAARRPMPETDRLVWIDMEMTGLAPETDRILELALIVTDAALNVVAQAPVWVVRQAEDILGGMDAWNTSTHGKSGLIDKVRASTHDEARVEQEALAFLRLHAVAKASPMSGNSICQDRRFLARWMPELESFFHYRNLDVSTLKELCRRWRPELLKGVPKEGKHEALADVLESIQELRYYRDHFIRA
jgi:oligoribonuclease